MIRSDSVPVWPDQVVLEEGFIYDMALGIRHPVNETGQILLGEVDGRRSVAEIARAACTRYDWPEAEVRTDLLEMIVQLNRGYLMNIRREEFSVRVRNRLISLLILLRTLRGPAAGIRERISLDSGRGLAGVMQTIAIAVFRALGVQLLIVSAAVYGFLGALGLMDLPGGLAFFASLFLGLILHEAGHAAAFIRLSTPEEQAFFCLRPGALQIVHKRRPPWNEVVISVAGPLTPGLCAVILLIIHMAGWFPDGWDYTSWLLIAAFAVHLIFLIPPLADGRKIWKSLLVLPTLKRVIPPDASGKEE